MKTDLSGPDSESQPGSLAPGLPAPEPGPKDGQGPRLSGFQGCASEPGANDMVDYKLSIYNVSWVGKHQQMFRLQLKGVVFLVFSFDFSFNQFYVDVNVYDV